MEDVLPLSSAGAGPGYRVQEAGGAVSGPDPIFDASDKAPEGVGSPGGFSPDWDDSCLGLYPAKATASPEKSPRVWTDDVQGHVRNVRLRKKKPV